MNVGEHVQVWVVLIGAVLLLAPLWRDLDPLASCSTASALLATAMVLSVMLLAVTSVVAVRVLIARR